MRAKESFPILALLLIAGFLLFWNLGASSFRNTDEGMYAQCAREMVETGDYLTLRYLGDPFLEKPPIKIWLISLGYKILGMNEWGARFSSGLFAIGAVALTGLLGSALFGRSVGLLAAAILLSSSQFIHEHCGRTAECEPETVFFFVLAILCLWRVSRDPRWLYGFAASLGLLAMVKGPVAVPVLVTSILYLAVLRSRAGITVRSVVLGVLVFVAVAAPWHVHQLVTHGTAFKRMYLDTQILGRFASDMPEDLVPVLKGRTESLRILYYPKVAFYSLFPWSVFALPALIYVVWGSVKRRTAQGMLLLLWIIPFGLVITLSKGKLPWYVIPVLPAVAISVAQFCRSLYRERSARLLLGITILALVVSSLFVPSPEYDPYARRSLTWPGGKPNVVPVWELEPPYPFWAFAPLLVSVGLAFAVTGRQFIRRYARRACWNARASLQTVFFASFFFFGMYLAAVPLRGADLRGEIARCVETVQAAEIDPERVVLVGERSAKLGLACRNRFYVSQLAGRADGSVFVRQRMTPVAFDPALHTPGALVLSDPTWRKRLSKLGQAVYLSEEDGLDVFYIRDRP